jgi:hypothetical protein
VKIVPQSLIDSAHEYQTHWRHQDLTAFAPISEVYSLFPEEPKPTLGWPSTWPNHDRHGVYFVFYADMRLSYVGKASHRHIGNRLSKHFVYDDKGGCRIYSSGGWKERPTFVASIVMEHAFEAPALEEFLIAKLNPPDNFVGNNSRKIAYIKT